MPHEPLVAAIMLTKDRPAMAARAVRAFRAQTYPNKRVLVVDSGPSGPFFEETEDLREPCFVGIDTLSIGALRNHAAKYLRAYYTHREDLPEIFVHFDDDDYSHPNRIAEQVAHLQASGADVVGYNELLFWRTRIMIDDRSMPDGYGEAWLYKHRTNAPGTSLCYWRKTWERKPFPDLPKPSRGDGEDWHWLKGLNVATVPCFRAMDGAQLAGEPKEDIECEPRLIASIHGGNTQSYDLEGIIERGSQEWRRVPEWDDYARKAMAL